MILGFPLGAIRGKSSAGTSLINSKTVLDVEVMVHALYVYTDVVESILVGDTQAPLLRIVDASGSVGKNVHRLYNPAHYLPINKRSFDSIEIDIRTDTGVPVPFESGRLSLTLHFRRAIEPLFSSS